MPSLLRKLKSFARFRERARAAKAANGNPAPQPSDADDAADDAGEADDAASPAPVTAPAVIPDQRLRPQPPGVAVTSAADNTYSASADKIIVVDVDDVTADNAVVGTAKRPQRGSSHAIPPSPPAPPSSMLEALPAELRLQVLSYISDLCDLKALVFASPVFSQQYRLDRQHFLGRVLLRSLGSLTAEAYAVQGSSTIYSRSPRPLPAETVEQFIHSYVSRRFAPPELILQDCTLTDLAEMAAFYLSVAQPLLPQCAALFLQQLNPSLEVGSLSATEKTRLLRALYRFQLYCNIFGQGPEPALRFRAMEWLADPYILDLFFGSFHPWEVEEIDCIYVLIRNKYDAVFKAVERDLVMKPKITKYDRPTTPPGFWDSNEEGRASN
ncbi:hypothetical protein F5144DRAFT_353095 [Chaetomium tenue]|uniref:Uncharacterized protein n=1 Tax=Chaetomium tenue TaxID=1854479 RepID=A0ACB7NXS3_9PEZI|nr:hypothetical protein F5144DRAFT_353095 [Chaetomium globosum]